jgi:hypothetical protein
MQGGLRISAGGMFIPERRHLFFDKPREGGTVERRPRASPKTPAVFKAEIPSSPFILFSLRRTDISYPYGPSGPWTLP